MAPHPYRTPSEPDDRPPQRPVPCDAGELGLLLFMLGLGLVPVVGAFARDRWTTEASLGGAMVMFAAWQLVVELAQAWRSRD